MTTVVQSASLDEDPALSPDDRLLPYASEESGRELCFLSCPDRMMAVDVTPGPVPRFSTPRELFRFPADSFDVSPDGQRFVAATFAGGGAEKPLTLVSGWPQRLVPRCSRAASGSRAAACGSRSS